MTEPEDHDAEPVAQSPLTCFVIGPIGNRLAADGSPERETYEEALRVMQEVIEPACRRNGLVPVRADSLARAGEITEQIFHRLRDDDVVIADLTDANPNVMYELGLRHTQDKLTTQIGEYRRLPFDINTIRTIQFSRSAVGLFTARDELGQMLEAGLVGAYDPVTATRVWNLGSNTGGSEAGDEPERRADASLGDEADDERGFIDILAEAEEQQDVVTSSTQDVAEIMGRMGELAEDAAERARQGDAAGKGMRGRLAVLTRYAKRLGEIADDLDAAVEQYVAAIRSVSDGNLTIIGRMEEDPEELEDGREFGMLLRRLAAGARESMASSSGLTESIKDNVKLSKVLREPSARVTAALDRFADATAVMDEWDRRLQSLGIPMPSEEWQPEAEDNEAMPTSDGAEDDDGPPKDSEV